MACKRGSNIIHVVLGYSSNGLVGPGAFLDSPAILCLDLLGFISRLKMQHQLGRGGIRNPTKLTSKGELHTNCCLQKVFP